MHVTDTVLQSGLASFGDTARSDRRRRTQKQTSCRRNAPTSPGSHMSAASPSSLPRATYFAIAFIYREIYELILKVPRRCFGEKKGALPEHGAVSYQI